MTRRTKTKTSQRRIVRDHYATLRDQGTGERRLRDHVEQFGLPVVAGLLTWLIDWAVDPGTGAAMITVAGLFAAFQFQLVIQLLDRASAWAGENPPPGPVTSHRASLLHALSANAAYAAIASSAAAAAALLATISSEGAQKRVLAAVMVVLVAHMATTLLLITRRAYLLTITSLREARTGAGLENR